jgi:thymidylate kinase
MKREKGLFIVVDGNEACGKTTSIDIIDKYLKGKNKPTLSTRAIGYGTMGETMRAEFLGKNKPDLTELLMCLTMVTDAINDYVETMVNNGDTVILDRYYTSTYVYQAMEKEFKGKINAFDLTKWLIVITTIVQETLKPDAIFLIHSDYENTRNRLAQRNVLNRLDHMDEELFNFRNKRFKDSIHFCHSCYQQPIPHTFLIENNTTMQDFESSLIARLDIILADEK